MSHNKENFAHFAIISGHSGGSVAKWLERWTLVQVSLWPLAGFELFASDIILVGPTSNSAINTAEGK